MSIFSVDAQRRVRLRNAKKFDLQPVLGEPLVVHIGELPQAQQGKLLESVEVRRELLERLEAGTGGQLEPQLAGKLLKAQQELIGAALLDANGDRMTVDDTRTLLELMPINEVAQTLMQEMMNAVYERIGGKKADAVSPGTPAPEPVGK